MTVEELIQELVKFPKDLPVIDFEHDYITEVSLDSKYDEDNDSIDTVLKAVCRITLVPMSTKLRTEIIIITQVVLGQYR